MAVDAGAVAEVLDIEEQKEVRDVLLTHCHLDHVRDLPFLLINTFRDHDPLRVWGCPHTLKSLRDHLLNREIWYDAFKLPSETNPSIVGHPLSHGEWHAIAGLRVYGFPLKHTVPSTGWLVDDGATAVFFAGDTSEESALEAPNALAGGRLKAVFIEASFPDADAPFAALTGHLTPVGVGRAAKCLAKDVAVLVTHMKPGKEDAIEADLRALGDPRIRAVGSGERFDF
jgi:ribonuclease BN (tRNA processing enzyme)